MALQVMKSMNDDSMDDMILESEQILNKGYDHLLTFEANKGGYEWFGADPGHEALTAYGLMQFHEMKEVI